MTRPNRYDALFGVVAGVAGLWLIALGRGLTFFADEWEFIQARSLTDLSTWFVPHGEHWSTVPALLYRAVFEVVGLRSYVPYHVVLIVLHLLVAAATYALLRRATAPVVALALSVIVLFFGSGYENLFWAFQYGFVGTTLLCLVALLVLDGAPTPPRVAVLAIVVLAALMSSGLGLGVAVIVAVELALREQWRRHLWIPALGAAIYLAWFAAIGRVNVGAQGALGPQALIDVPVAIVNGVVAVAAGVLGFRPIGFGVVVGVAGVVALLVSATRAAMRGALSPRVVAIAAGVVVTFALVGVARTEAGADAPRIVYFGAVLIIVALGELLGKVRLPPPDSRRWPIMAGVTVLAAISIAGNVSSVLVGRDVFARRADITRALVDLELHPPPGATFDRAKPQQLVPSADIVASLVARYGSPLHDEFADVPPVSAEARAKAAAYLFESGPLPVP